MSPARLASLLIAGLTLIPHVAAAFAPDLSDLDSIPLALVHAPLAKRIEAAAAKTRPLQFAVKAPLSVALRDGAWDLVDRDTARWRLRVRSPDATSLSFELARFHLPAEASLWIYDESGAVVQGPYTAADHNREGKLWTAMVPGDVAILELRAPADARDAVALELAAVGHGFRTFEDAIAPKSSACNVDVACPQGDPWRKEMRAIAMIAIDGSILCTGEALNDARQDNDPLFITANHCGVGQNLCGPEGTSYCSPSSVVFYWNFQNPTCRSSTGAGERDGDGSTSQSQSGATVLAADVSSDFTLLRLNRAPDAAFNVYLAGWNATGSTPQSGVAIHHPGGDEKSISVFAAPAERADTCIQGSIASCQRDVRAWGVHWSSGTTEQGSSGAALWDESHLVVGWLSGGRASCSDPNGEDFFARMEAAWTAGSANDQQLKHWLSPDGDARSVCGRDRSAPSCSNAAAPHVEERGGAVDFLSLLALAVFARRRSRFTMRS